MDLHKRIVYEGDCWLIMRTINHNGYARVTARVNGKMKAYMAHRVMYEQEIGEIPEGMVIDHLCRTRNCINPDHLEVVSIAENLQRGINWNRNKTHCNRGHEYSEVNTHITHKGKRECRECRKIWNRKYEARQFILT